MTSIDGHRLTRKALVEGQTVASRSMASNETANAFGLEKPKFNFMDLPGIAAIAGFFHPKPVERDSRVIRDEVDVTPRGE